MFRANVYNDAIKLRDKPPKAIITEKPVNQEVIDERANKIASLRRKLANLVRHDFRD